MSGSKYLRIPFEEKEVEKIQDELSLSEQKEAIVRAYNESVESAESVGEDEDELAQYDSVRDIREDDSLTEAEKKRREIKAKRRSDISTR